MHAYICKINNKFSFNLCCKIFDANNQAHMYTSFKKMLKFRSIFHMNNKAPFSLGNLFFNSWINISD